MSEMSPVFGNGGFHPRSNAAAFDVLKTGLYVYHESPVFLCSHIPFLKISIDDSLSPPLPTQ